MSILSQARDALTLITNGREALEAIAAAVKDGRQAISADEQAELDALLAREKQESQAAHDKLAEAIRQARGG